MCALMKEALAASGGRGGGTKDMAQGGVTKVEQLSAALEQVPGKLK
jgi:alanyl-tRNA synthetase